MGSTKIQFKDGSFYEGEGINREPFVRHGKGTYVWQNQDTYSGEWNQNKREGFGTFTSADTGDIYEGNWENDHRNGIGIKRFSDGGKYEGEWKNDKFHGKTQT